MKTLKFYCILITVLLVLPAYLAAQDSSLDKLTKSFGEMDDVTYAQLQSNDIKIESEGNEGMNYVINNLEVVRMISIEKNRKKSEKYFAEFSKIVSQPPYIEVVTIVDEEETFSIYVNRGSDNNIKEAVLITREGKDANFIYMKGDINLEKLGGFDKLVQLQNMKIPCMDGKKMEVKDCKDKD